MKLRSWTLIFSMTFGSIMQLACSNFMKKSLIFFRRIYSIQFRFSFLRSSKFNKNEVLPTKFFILFRANICKEYLSNVFTKNPPVYIFSNKNKNLLSIEKSKIQCLKCIPYCSTWRYVLFYLTYFYWLDQIWLVSKLSWWNHRWTKTFCLPEEE